MTRPAFASTLGPKDAKIALVGEAFGEQEDMAKLPFQGYSGQELTRILKDAGIERRDCLLTNVFAFRPQSNNIHTLCAPKSEVGAGYPLRPISLGKYIKPEYFGEIKRLSEELSIVKPNLVVALGNTACWALLGSATISKYRGAVAYGTGPGGDLMPGKGHKILPTYHPAYVCRNWSARPIVVADFIKANREKEFPEIRRPKRNILYDLTLSEIDEWISQNYGASHTAVDIETENRQIKMIQFATRIDEALVIEFVDRTKERNSYWPDLESEVAAWKRVEIILKGPSIKIFQNGLFDLQYLWRMGLAPENCLEDTMLKHHARYPEMQKGLGFMASYLTDEVSWKLMRTEREELKRDE